MSRGTWDIIKRTKRFYVKNYRRAGSAVIVSIVMNVLLLMGIYYIYFSRPEHDFFATDGVTPPVSLIAMDQPNHTSTPMLANDQAKDDNYRRIPK